MPVVKPDFFANENKKPASKRFGRVVRSCYGALPAMLSLPRVAMAAMLAVAIRVLAMTFVMLAEGHAHHGLRRHAHRRPIHDNWRRRAQHRRRRDDYARRRRTINWRRAVSVSRRAVAVI